MQTVRGKGPISSRKEVRANLPSDYDLTYFDGLTERSAGNSFVFYDGIVPKISVNKNTGDMVIAGPNESV